MAKAKSNAVTTEQCVAPDTLEGHIFYGLKLDDGQKAFRDAIYDEGKRIVFSNSCSGSGKTTIAIATAVLMCKYRKYDDIVYVMHAVGDAQGYLPGTISEKSSVWFEGLYQALIAAGEVPAMVIRGESIACQKNGAAYVTPITDTYLRGSNIGANGRTVLCIDEAQNFDEHSLRKVLTRASDATKVIVIGHDGQIDLPNPERSAFLKCMRKYESIQDDRVAVCNLTKNYRGFVSRIADEAWG